jgi:hypothetical protein
MFKNMTDERLKIWLVFVLLMFAVSNIRSCMQTKEELISELRLFCHEENLK